MNNDIDPNLMQEAHAFDRQIEERIRNGHIPDLRLCEPCDWFYNNPWRRPEYVRLTFGETFESIREAIKDQVSSEVIRPRILEVGCGPGYMSLELAREGYDVTGLDLSERCIEISRKFANADPYKSNRGPLRYVAGNFLTELTFQPGSFDVVLFLGALHHFPDQTATLDRVRTLLKPDGLVIAIEPARDRVTRGSAVFVHLLRVILSVQSGFFKNYEVPSDIETRDQEVDRIFREMRYETEEGGKEQSPNDNEAGYAEMIDVLSQKFDQVDFQWRHAFFHKFIAGLRFDESKNLQLAGYLRDIDKELCREGVLDATDFLYVGRKIE